MALHLNAAGLARRHCLLAALPLPALASAPAHTATLQQATLQEAMQRAQALRDEAVAAGDQAYGAVVLCGSTIVGAAPSRVVTAKDTSAHAEMEALRDAARTLRSPSLAGCTLVSTSRPCRMCEAAAAKAGIARMVHGEALSDAGPPR